MTTQEAGRKGGKRRAKNLSAEALTEIGRKGAKVRWQNRGKKAVASERKSADRHALFGAPVGESRRLTRRHKVWTRRTRRNIGSNYTKPKNR